MKRACRVLILSGLVALPSPMLAQETPVLAQDLSATLADRLSGFDGVEGLPDALSCTALYRSLALVLGEDSPLAADFSQREGVLATVAASLWASAERGGTAQAVGPDEVFATLIAPIDAATRVVMGHMSDVMEATGAPFDEQIFAAMDFCTALFTSLQVLPE